MRHMGFTLLGALALALGPAAQAQQADHVGDMASALADGFGKDVLGMCKFNDQALISDGFIQRRQVLAL